MRNSNIIKLSELNTLPDKLLRNLAVAVARDIDSGAEDKNELLERIMVAVMSKRVGMPADLAPDVRPPTPAVPPAISYAIQTRSRRWVEVKDVMIRGVIAVGALLATLWLVSHS